jgi:hypothetical protein
MNADEITEIRFTRRPTSATIGKAENSLPIIIKRGDPGGCGIPSI